MFIEEGQSCIMFCLYCQRLWSGKNYDRDYESREDFNRSNSFKCPWCRQYNSIAALPEHKAEAMNGDRFSSVDCHQPPCPKCGYKYRFATEAQSNLIQCDKCGYNEEITHHHDDDKGSTRVLPVNH